MRGQFESGITENTVGKECEHNNNNNDWINGLPDCILSSIVSLLNLNDAMDAVPLVCRRWRGLDPMLKRVNLEFNIPNIYGIMDERLLEENDDEIDYTNLLEDYPRHDFVRRVNKVLELYHDKKVYSFKVAFFLTRESTATLDEWVRFAITKGASVLDLHLFLCAEYRADHDDYVFPCQLLSELNVSSNVSSSLRNLSLTRCVLRPPIGFGGFSQLTSLYMYDVIFDQTFIQRLCFEYCPFLESLTIRECKMGSDFILHGPSLGLRELTLKECLDVKRVDVSLPNLAYIEVLYAKPGVTFQITAKQLARMSILVSGGDNGLCHALTQFASFPGLETLHLLLMGEPEIPQSIPPLRHLKKLDLDMRLPSDEADLRTVISILKATPLLEELVLSLCPQNFCEEVMDFRGFTHDSLRKVKLQGFRSMPCEIEFAIYLLKNTAKLEIMMIDPFGQMYEGAGESLEIMGLDENYESNAHWEEQGRAIAQEKLKQVDTDARVIIM